MRPPSPARVAGFVFASQTDSEVIAHLVARAGIDQSFDLFEAVQRRPCHRTWREPTAWRWSVEVSGRSHRRGWEIPLVVGLGRERLLMTTRWRLRYTAQAAFLQDSESRRLSLKLPNPATSNTGRCSPRIRSAARLEAGHGRAGRARHYMIKEIRERPETVVDACRGPAALRGEATASRSGVEPVDRAQAPTRAPRRLRRVAGPAGTRPGGQ